MDSPQDLKIGFVQDYCDIHGRGKRRRGASVEAGVGEVHLRPIDGPYGQHGCIPQYTEGIGVGTALGTRGAPPSTRCRRARRDIEAGSPAV